MGFIITLFSWFCSILIYMLLGRAIMSWFVNPYTANPASFSYKLYALLTSLTEPIVRPARSFMSRFNTGPVDLSLFIAMIGIMVVRFVVITLLRILM